MLEENSPTLEYAKEYVEKTNRELEELAVFYNNLKEKQATYQKVINASLQQDLRDLMSASYDIEKKLRDIQSMKSSIPTWRW
tara:strand:- start:30 stop:275 length:246 start_codon:yes stop_codon:yes gene_type:complete